MGGDKLRESVGKRERCAIVVVVTGGMGSVCANNKQFAIYRENVQEGQVVCASYSAACVVYPERRTIVALVNSNKL